MNIIQKIKNICDILECQPIYDSFVKRIQQIEHNSIIIGVLGISNTGKSSIINAIAGTFLPTSPISSMQSYFVSYESKREPAITPSSEWMKTHRISFLEKEEKMFSNKSKDIEYATYFADFDICLYLIDAQMAYTKNDALIIEHLNKFGIPTLVYISKLEKLPINDRQEVVSFLTNKLPKSKIISMVDNKKFVSIMDNIPSIVSAIEKFKDSEYIQSVRENLTNFFIIDAVTHLFDECKSKIVQCQDSEQRIEKMTTEKFKNLSTLETEWMHIELKLSARKQKTEDKLRERLANRKSEMLRRLSHDIEVSSDISHYWNKELCYRIDEMIRAELQACTQLINMDIINTLRWLQEEIQKNVKKQTSFIPTITCTIDGKEITLDKISISDNKSLRIITRIGTIATVFVAGCLMSTSGVYGAVMATSMLSGLAADWMMGNKNNKAKTKVMELLPSILDKMELIYINQISESLNKSYKEILKSLKKSQAEWETQSQTTIKEERIIAIHNCNCEKYHKCMQEINEISAVLINQSF